MKSYFENIKFEKNKMVLLLFALALIALVGSLISLLCKNENLADIFAIIFYIIFSLGVIYKFFYLIVGKGRN